jgi:hypothetical protein
VPVAPANLQIVTTATPTLRIRNATDPEQDPLTYEFEVQDDAGTVIAAATAISGSADETAWSIPSPLAENALYSWRARAFDGQAAGAWTASWRFRVNAVHDPPTAPAALAPAEGAVLETSQVTLVIRNAVSPDGLPLTYAFELFRAEPDGGITLVDRAQGVPEAAGATAWTAATALADGAYQWRSRADDGTAEGPWMSSARFTVRTDTPPAAPAGLSATPGDGEVMLRWAPNTEPDLAGYRIYRAATSGGPYTLAGESIASEFTDRGRANGVTVFYVVTAIDARFESRPSPEAAATPQRRAVVAEILLRPGVVGGECLIQGVAAGSGCPAWLYAAIELPGAAGGIEPASVRLAGAIRPESAYHLATDRDGDGLPETEVRFSFTDVAPRLRLGDNTLLLTGRTTLAEFSGSAPLTVRALEVDLMVTPRTLNRRSRGQWVQAQLVFRQCVPAALVSVPSLRLNGVLPAAAVVSVQGERLTLKFDREALERLLPAGAEVPVWVTGAIHGLPFEARDVLRVIP